MQSLIESKDQEKLKACTHCGSAVVYAVTSEDSNESQNIFCCEGCLNVWNFLKQNNLDEYYNYLEKDKGQSSRSINSKFEEFDTEQFYIDYVKELSSGQNKVKFYLEGVHCLACLWIIEKIPSLLEGVISSRLALESSRAEFEVEKDFKISALASLINKMGYRPHPLKNNSETEKFRIREERSLLIKMALALTCMGNIMVMTLAIYGGASGIWEESFNYFSMGLILPVVLYSAIPFYKNAYHSINNKKFSIDILISFSIILAFLVSSYNTLLGKNIVYFDSIGALVFLLLIGRYIILKAKKTGVDSSSLEFIGNLEAVNVLNKNSNKFEKKMAKYLEKEDIVKISKNEVLPADGKIIRGHSHLNNSLITGESNPVAVSVDDYIYAGSKNISNEIQVKLCAVGEDTYLGKILEDVNKSLSGKSIIANMADKWSKYLIFAVFFISITLFTFSYLNYGIEEAIKRTLGLVIITCPCALALAAPLVLSQFLNILNRNQIIVRDEKTIENLANTKNVFFDKTGTLTNGEFYVSSFPEELEDYKKYIFSLESKSSHPIAMSLVHFLRKYKNDYIVNNFLEIQGLGVQGIINGDFVQLQRNSDNESAQTCVDFILNNKRLGTIKLEDEIKESSYTLIERLKKLKIDPWIISGDNQKVVNKVGEYFKIPLINLKGELQPKQKEECLRTINNSVMIGDGANDAIALSKADVGIAVKGSIDLGLKAANIYLANDNLLNIYELIKSSKDIMKLIYISLVISLVYNVIGATLAITGHITPLWAAVLMPISSLSVLLVSIFGVKYILNNREFK